MIEATSLGDVRQYLQICNLSPEKFKARVSPTVELVGGVFRRLSERVHATSDEDTVTSLLLDHKDRSKIVFYNDLFKKVVKEYKIKNANILKVFVAAGRFEENKQVIVLYTKDDMTLEVAVLRMGTAKGKPVVRKKESVLDSNIIYSPCTTSLPYRNGALIPICRFLMEANHFKSDVHMITETGTDKVTSKALCVSSYSSWQTLENDFSYEVSTLSANRRCILSCQHVSRQVDNRIRSALLFRDIRLGTSQRQGGTVITETCWSDHLSMVVFDHAVGAVQAKSKNSTVVVAVEDLDESPQSYFFFPDGVDAEQTSARAKLVTAKGMRLGFAGVVDFNFSYDLSLFAIVTNTNQLYLYENFKETLRAAAEQVQNNVVKGGEASGFFTKERIKAIIPKEDTDDAYIEERRNTNRRLLSNKIDDIYAGKISEYSIVPLRVPDIVIDMSEPNKTIKSVYIYKSLHMFVNNRTMFLVLVCLHDNKANYTTIQGMDSRLNVLFETKVDGVVSNIDYRDCTDYQSELDTRNSRGANELAANLVSSFMMVRTKNNVIKIDINFGGNQTTSVVSRDMNLERIGTRTATQTQMGRRLDI